MFSTQLEQVLTTESVDSYLTAKAQGTDILTDIIEDFVAIFGVMAVNLRFTQSWQASAKIEMLGQQMTRVGYVQNVRHYFAELRFMDLIKDEVVSQRIRNSTEKTQKQRAESNKAPFTYSELRGGGRKRKKKSNFKRVEGVCDQDTRRKLCKRSDCPWRHPWGDSKKDASKEESESG